MSEKDNKPLTLRTLAESCGGQVIAATDEQADQVISHVVIDDRAVREGSLFVPIRGERFDGHDFIDRAWSAGARAVVSEHALLNHSGPCVLVPDSLAALQAAAQLHHDWYSPVTVAVTGSAGKTTTKEMIACVLSRRFETLRTEGNLNNQTGVPLTLFQIGDSTEAAVVEMGMNHPGEIDRIAKAANPDIGVITNVGTAHIEYLGSREGILAAKCELLSHVKPDGLVLLNGDDDMLQTVDDPRMRTFGETASCDYRAVNVTERGLSGTDFTLEWDGGSFDIQIPSPGRYMVYAALAAAACGLYLGMEPQEIAAGIADYVPAGSRMRVLSGIYTVIDDTYNANAPAMKAALDVLAASPGRKVAVLGEMRELGEQSERLHSEVLEHACSLPVDKILAVGSAYGLEGPAEEKDGRVLRFASQDALFGVLSDIVQPGDTILVKGSRGAQMERTVGRLVGEDAGTAHS